MSRPIYILAGQSNAVHMDRAGRPLRAIEVSGAPDGAFTAEDDFQQREGGFHRALSAIYPDAAFLSSVFAFGSSPFTYDRETVTDWFDAPGLVEGLIERVTKIADFATAEGGAHLAGIVWAHGEGDAHRLAAAEQPEGADMGAVYQAAFDRWLTRVDDGLAAAGVEGAGEFEVIVAPLSALATASENDRAFPGWEAVRDGQVALGAAPRVTVVDPDPLIVAEGLDGQSAFRDQFHYTDPTEGDAGFGAVLIGALADAFGETVSGGAGLDRLAGGDGADVLIGLGGLDILTGGGGADVLDGGAGANDRASYHTAATGVAADLQGLNASAGDARGDHYVGVEALFGSAQNDRLFGDGAINALWGANGHDVLNGRAGDDRIFGGSGNDRIIGHQGADELTGGAGRDAFIFQNAAESAANAPDLILDFETGRDVIDLRRLQLDGFEITASAEGALLTAGDFAIRFADAAPDEGDVLI